VTIRVVFVIGNLDVGGAERHLLQILPHLARRGIHPSVYTLSHKGELAPELEAKGITVVAPPFAENFRRFPPWVRKTVLLLLSAARLWILMLQQRPDVVHFFLPEAYLLGGMLSLFAPISVRVMSRRSLNDYQKRRPILGQIECWLHSRMDAVIGNSLRVATQLAQEGVSEDRLGLIYNGLDMSVFDEVGPAARERMRGELGIPIDALVMVLVANLIPYKGHADLLDALGNIAAELPADWVLLCVGRDEGIGNTLRSLADELGIGGHIRWLGQRDDIPELLAAADLGLSCSHEEGFSNAVLECVAAGLPMVVTDVGGNGEAVIDGESGYVIPPHSPRAFADAVRRLTADSDLRASMGRRAQARIRSRFSADRCVSNYARLYEGLAGPTHSLRRELRMAEQQGTSNAS
jgi:glycosyltransferase involved in cell wall biosynthesis